MGGASACACACFPLRRYQSNQDSEIDKMPRPRGNELEREVKLGNVSYSVIVDLVTGCLQ